MLKLGVKIDHVATPREARYRGPGSGEPSPLQRTGSQFIELHTGQFAEHFHDKSEGEAELQRLIAGAQQAHALGLKVNAGHGLNYENLPVLHRVPHLVELNIGHSIVSRAVFVGMATAVKEMPALMRSTFGPNCCHE